MLLRLAAISAGGAVLGWHGARRWVVIFSYFHLALVGGENSLAACVRDMKKKRMYIRQLREIQIKYAMALCCYDCDGTGFI